MQQIGPLFVIRVAKNWFIVKKVTFGLEKLTLKWQPCKSRSEIRFIPAQFLKAENHSFATV